MLQVRRVYLAAALFAAVAFGQITTTGIHGIVRDPSGAVVPNATIRLRDLGTGIETETTSTGEGNFAFANLQAAMYKLTASAAGFQTAIVDRVTVDSGRITDVSIEMKLGAATETVSVSASAVQLETTSNEVGTTISTNLIQFLQRTRVAQLCAADGGQRERQRFLGPQQHVQRAAQRVDEYHGRRNEQ